MTAGPPCTSLPDATAILRMSGSGFIGSGHVMHWRFSTRRSIKSRSDAIRRRPLPALAFAAVLAAAIELPLSRAAAFSIETSPNRILKCCQSAMRPPGHPPMPNLSCPPRQCRAGLRAALGTVERDCASGFELVGAVCTRSRPNLSQRLAATRVRELQVTAPDAAMDKAIHNLEGFAHNSQPDF